MSLPFAVYCLRCLRVDAQHACAHADGHHFVPQPTALAPLHRSEVSPSDSAAMAELRLQAEIARREAAEAKLALLQQMNSGAAAAGGSQAGGDGVDVAASAAPPAAGGVGGALAAAALTQPWAAQNHIGERGSVAAAAVGARPPAPLDAAAVAAAGVPVMVAEHQHAAGAGADAQASLESSDGGPAAAAAGRAAQRPKQNIKRKDGGHSAAGGRSKRNRTIATGADAPEGGAEAAGVAAIAPARARSTRRAANVNAATLLLSQAVKLFNSGRYQPRVAEAVMEAFIHGADEIDLRAPVKEGMKEETLLEALILNPTSAFRVANNIGEVGQRKKQEVWLRQQVRVMLPQLLRLIHLQFVGDAQFDIRSKVIKNIADNWQSLSAQEQVDECGWHFRVLAALLETCSADELSPLHEHVRWGRGHADLTRLFVHWSYHAVTAQGLCVLIRHGAAFVDLDGEASFLHRLVEDQKLNVLQELSEHGPAAARLRAEIDYSACDGDGRTLVQTAQHVLDQQVGGSDAQAEALLVLQLVQRHEAEWRAEVEQSLLNVTPLIPDLSSIVLEFVSADHAQQMAEQRRRWEQMADSGGAADVAMEPVVGNDMQHAPAAAAAAAAVN